MTTPIRFEGPENAQTVVLGYDRILLEEALESARRALVAWEEENTRAEAGASAASILCAAAACEAWLSELLAQEDLLWPLAKGLRKAVLAKGRSVEKWKTFLGLVLPRARLVGGQAYERFYCLMELRNHIAHRGADWHRRGDFPIRLKPCTKSGMIPVHPDTASDWTSRVFLVEVAQWASRSAKEWIELVEYSLDPVWVSALPALRDRRLAERDSS